MMELNITSWDSSSGMEEGCKHGQDANSRPNTNTRPEIFPKEVKIR